MTGQPTVRFKNLDKAEFHANAEAGYSDSRLAEIYGVSERTILRWRVRMGVPSSFWRAQRSPCGTKASYLRGCRCDACKAANREHHRQVVARLQARGLAGGDPRHGTYSGYTQWGCRCEPCRSVGSERNLAYRDKSTQRSRCEQA